MRVENILEFGPVKGLKMGYAPWGKPLMSVICYQVDNILIDTGAKNTRPSLLKMLGGKSLDAVYLTHYHEDHAGNAAYLNKALELPIYAHPLTKKKLSQKVKLQPYEKYMWGNLECIEVNPVDTAFSSSNFHFRCLHTPGHSSDHQVFLEENQGWLFSGDMYLGARIKYFRRDENIVQTINSLKMMTALNFDKLFCGHNPQMHNPQKALQRKVDHLESVYGEVRQLYSQGWPKKTIIKTLVKGRESWLPKAITLGDVSYKNMITSSINCLQEETP